MRPWNTRCSRVSNTNHLGCRSNSFVGTYTPCSLPLSHKKFNSNFIYMWRSFQHFCILVPPFSKIVGNSFSVRLSGFDSLTYQSSTIFSALRIHVSPECKEVLDRLGGYVLQERGFVEMKVSERLSILHDQIF